MARRRMGPVDAIWLNMDRPDNLMVIDSLLFLDGRADWDRVLEVYVTRMLGRYPVFRARPVPPRALWGSPRWEDDPDFDLDRHVHRVTLGDPSDQGLQRYVEQQVPEPLDRAHPLWELHLVDGHHAGSVVHTRIHHALADGIALMGLLLSLTDPEPSGSAAGAPAPPGAGRTGATVPRQPTTRSAGRVLRGLAGLADPSRAADALTQLWRAGEVADKLLLGRAPAGPFAGPPGRTKRTLWTPTFPLEDARRVGHLAGATVNDVLMAAVAGALASYVRERGGEPEDLTTMVPVNVRPPGEPLPRDLGNRFALVLFRYPVGVADTLERIAETRHRMDTIKGSPEATLTYALIEAIGRTTSGPERLLVDFFADKAIGVTTNVAGPAEQRYLAGLPVRSLLGWVPGSGDQTLGVCICSYAGRVQVGFKADAGRVPGPEVLVRAFTQEIAGLSRLAHAGARTG